MLDRTVFAGAIDNVSSLHPAIILDPMEERVFVLDAAIALVFGVSSTQLLEVVARLWADIRIQLGQHAWMLGGMVSGCAHRRARNTTVKPATKPTTTFHARGRSLSIIHTQLQPRDMSLSHDCYTQLHAHHSYGVINGTRMPSA